MCQNTTKQVNKDLVWEQVKNSSLICILNDVQLRDASDSVQFLKAVDLLWKDHCRTMVSVSMEICVSQVGMVGHKAGPQLVFWLLEVCMLCFIKHTAQHLGSWDHHML